MISGHWSPGLRNLQHVFYGPGCVEKHLLGILKTSSSKVFIVTGTSLATRTPLVQQLEQLLGDHHAGTFSEVRQHGPLEDVDKAVAAILSQGEGVDTILSLGGGSPIDTAKVISLRVSETRGKFLTHLTIPTTLSAAECTSGGGYTRSDGVKVGFRKPEMGVSVIFYDSYYARYTPKDLWLSTAMRAMDHAVECMYHPHSTEVPWKALSQWVVRELFECLPLARDSHPNDENVNTRLMLAAYASSGLKGDNLPGGMGLSHSLGHALGSPYGIPHGITSCMTLGKVVKLKAFESPVNAGQIARLSESTGGSRTGDNFSDAIAVGDRILELVQSLNLNIGTLSDRGVSKDEVPIIMQRALGGITKGPLYDQVKDLIQSLF
uniref:Hemiketal-phenalenone deoxygenase n=1 Tax=Talaromyces stipitatus TaxID=28564 RepID=A0A2U9K746_9EURO|nr:hemiketal-phenalenone deoxygenase [Talaromyces stipitatus]